MKKLFICELFNNAILELQNAIYLPTTFFIDYFFLAILNFEQSSS